MLLMLLMLEQQRSRRRRRWGDRVPDRRGLVEEGPDVYRVAGGGWRGVVIGSIIIARSRRGGRCMCHFPRRKCDSGNGSSGWRLAIVIVRIVELTFNTDVGMFIGVVVIGKRTTADDEGRQGRRGRCRRRGIIITCAATGVARRRRRIRSAGVRCAIAVIIRYCRRHRTIRSGCSGDNS